MNKITIIIAPQGGGKTTKARQLTKGKKSLWLQEKDVMRSSYAFSNVEEDTDVVIIDGAVDMNIIYKMYYNKTIIVNKKYKEPIEIPRPEMIITIDYSYLRTEQFFFMANTDILMLPKI